MRNLQAACRMEGLDQAIFCEMNTASGSAASRGMTIIDLGIGSPDGRPGAHIVTAMKDALDLPDAFGYPTTQGSVEFRDAVAVYYSRRFGVTVDPGRQVHSLMGSQDGLAHMALAFLDPGDIAIMPDPGYPIYHASVSIAGGRMYPLPLREHNGFLPDFKEIPGDVAEKAKLMILNYPNNPLAVTADLGFLSEALDFAVRNGIVLCYDNAYSELAFDGFVPPSILQVPGAVDHCVEFNSLSKAFNMAGCRIAYAVGAPGIIRPLSCIKSHMDYGVFKVAQAGAVAALTGPLDQPSEARERYARRADLLLGILKGYGWTIRRPQATMFVWAKLPMGLGMGSQEFAMDLARETGVVVIPGSAFGAMGEGYVRMALVQPDALITEGAHRIGKYILSACSMGSNTGNE